MPAVIPEIPAATNLDRQFQKIFTPVKETLDIWAGRTGDPNQRLVRVGELADLVIESGAGGGGIDPADFLKVNGSNAMEATLNIATDTEPKFSARANASGASLGRFQNSTTGYGATDGLHVGILADERAWLWNYEATDFYIGTNNKVAILIESGAGIELYDDGVKKLTVNSGGISVVGDVSATGDISATQIQAVDVDTTAPTGDQVLAYDSGNTRYEPKNLYDLTNGARVYRSTTQNLTAGAFTPLSFDTEVIDNESIWAIGNPTRFTAPTDGWYVMEASFALVAPTSATADFRWTKNGTDYLSGGRIPLSGAGDGATLVAVAFLSASDYVEIEVLCANAEQVLAATATNYVNNSASIVKI